MLERQTPSAATEPPIYRYFKSPNRDKSNHATNRPTAVRPGAMGNVVIESREQQSPLACGRRYAVPPKGISTRTRSLMYQKRCDRFDCDVCGFAGKRRCLGIPLLHANDDNAIRRAAANEKVLIMVCLLRIERGQMRMRLACSIRVSAPF